MRRVLVSELRGGEKVGKVIYDKNGYILLHKSAEVLPAYIQRLKDFEISFIYVDDAISADIDVDDIISDETRFKLKTSIKEVADRLVMGQSVNIGSMDDVINNAMDEILGQRELMIMVSDIRGKDEDIFSHSASVCAMAIALGSSLGYNTVKLKELANGAMLHDIGKVEIQKQLKKSNWQITKEELETIEKTHSKVGYEFLGKDTSFSPTLKVIVLMHHELMDGSGYPLGVKGEKFHDLARVVAVCDAFDRLVYGISTVEAMPVFRAMEYLRTMTHLYDPEIVKEFWTIVAAYPNGTTVRLSTGERAIIVRQNKGFPNRPVVRVIETKERLPIAIPYEINLVENLTTFILE